MTTASRHIVARSAEWAVGPVVLLFLLLWQLRTHSGMPTGPDLTIHQWVLHHRTAGLTTSAVVATSTGTGPVPYAAVLLAGWTAGSRSVRRRNKARTAGAAVAVLLIGQGVRAVLMSAVARPPPPVADWAAGAAGFAFPSGHTTTTAMAAGLIAWSVLRGEERRAVTRTVLALCALWAVTVGGTRIYLGVHWPTDVLGGWLLGAAWLALTLPILTRFADGLGGPGELRCRVSGQRPAGPSISPPDSG